jgi:2-dehydropantoate 2-reductase
VKLLTHSFGEYTFQPEHVFSSVEDASNRSKQAAGNQIQWDYVVVTTKALPTTSHSEATLIKPLVSAGTTIVLIQNGIGVELAYRSMFPKNMLLSAVTVVSAEQIEHGVVRQNRWTRISFGPYFGDQSNQSDAELAERGVKKTRDFAKLLRDGGVKDPEECNERDLQFVRWHKVAVSDHNTFKYVN